MTPRKPSDLAIKKAMLAALEAAAKHPDQWHDIGKDETNQAAIARLVECDVVEVRDFSNQFRLKRGAHGSK